MSNFITNNETSDLKKRLIELIKKSDELKFLVGFFYFSGIKELYEGLKSNPDTKIKVLVGLNVDKAAFGLVESANNEDLSGEEKTYKFIESIKKSLNTEDFDNKEFYEQVRYFIELIQKDNLVIRKTYNPNHSKLYLFKLEESQAVKELFITGSSNLTRAGLTTQNEFNVEISSYGFGDAEKYFDDLWDEAVKITEFEETKKKLIEIIEKETLIKDVTPFEAFCLVLKTYIDTFEEKEIGETLIKTLEENGYTPYQYQLDAVKQALAIIEKNNGVIIADVVGLGKTIVACAIARQMKKRGIVICPPGLMGDRSRDSGWKKYLEEFGLHDWVVWSRGDLKSALKFLDSAKDIEAVIVDEVHWFRNQDTENYEILKNICREKQVILLTATPFNNRPGDILALLKLFITPKKSSITLESNLVDQFKAFKGIFDRLGYIKKYWNSTDESKRAKAQSYYKALFEEDNIDLKKVAQRASYLAKQIRNVIEPVTIRRNRLDLQNNPIYKNEVKNLSKVDDPKEWFFELSKEQSDFYTKIIEEYFGDPNEGGKFKGAIYRPFEYEKGLKALSTTEAEEKLSQDDNRAFQQQRNLFDFMRRLLVKRFESSFGSFEQSIKNFKNITQRCQEFIDDTGEYILDRSLLEKIYELDADEVERYLVEYEEKIIKGEYPKTHKRYKIDEFKNKNEFVQDIQNDINLFGEILEKLSSLELVKNDPKTACLVENLEREFNKKPKSGEPKRKIIVFTEYVDTVHYLEKTLIKHYGDRMLVVAGDLPSSKISKLNKNFDASYSEQEDEFDLLLTSDKISEGFNLNRAGMVINYDIPWNPVRVIQRLGRINRISRKVFEALYIVNFFPTEKGAELVKSREIAANKMFLIHSALGEDSKIFDVDEEPTPAGLFNKVQQNPDALEEESFYTKAYKEFLKIKQENPGLFENLKNYPPRIKVAKEGNENELLVFFTKGRLYVSGAQTDQTEINPYYLVFEDVFEKIICSREERALDWNTERFWQAYEAIKDFKDFRLGGVSEQSLEQKALNKLDFLIRSTNENVMPYKDFLRTLKEDILHFGTLADFTLRRIMNFKENAPRDIQELQAALGLDYLVKEKDRLKDQKKEIIIAIENKKL
ncbi:helicase [Candidatus Roizmanbacteria bacterium RIFCSPLOWO2_01_FULL_40_32]|nr:MAG: helicase [Candidatus Roizmanbacteria bacterium RIFCSPLOWO2_01_FULL_40_32]